MSLNNSFNKNNNYNFNENENNVNNENDKNENTNFKNKAKRVLVVIFIMTILYFIVKLILYGLEVSNEFPSLLKNMKTIDIMVNISYFMLTIIFSYISVCIN